MSQTPTIKLSLLILLASLVAFGPLSIDMYLPSLPTIAEDLNTPETYIQWSISGFLIGFCIGMLFYGPLSDRYGRKTILLIGIAVYLLSTLGCYMATTANQLLIARLLQALGGGAASVLARAMVRDIQPLDQAAHTLAMMHLVTMLAPLLAPFIGGYLLLAYSWRSIFLILFIFAFICFIAVLFVQETLPQEQRRNNLTQAFISYGHIIRNKQAIGYIICSSMTFGGMFAYITGSSFVFINDFHIPKQHFGWFFGSNIIGIMLYTYTANAFRKRYRPRQILRVSTTVACLAGVGLLLSTLLQQTTIWTMIFFIFCYVSVTGVIGANCVAYLMSLFPSQAGAASALIIASQFGAGFIASLIVSLLPFSAALNMALIMACCGLISFIALRSVNSSLTS